MLGRLSYCSEGRRTTQARLLAYGPTTLGSRPLRRTTLSSFGQKQKHPAKLRCPLRSKSERELIHSYNEVEILNPLLSPFFLALDEGKERLLCLIVRHLNGWMLEAVCRDAFQWAADSPVQTNLYPAHGVDHYACRIVSIDDM